MWEAKARVKPRLIDSQKALDDFLKDFKPKDIVAIDTEFVRRNTYYAKLSLIQLASQGSVYIFDAQCLNLRDLWDIIIDSGAKVVIHSGRQDLEILTRLYGRLPSNLIDTQIAAKYCGFRSAVSYGELCEKICNVQIDKTHQSGDWTSRPLSSSKISYAALDVEYLEKIYLYLQEILDAKSHNDSVKSDIEKELLDPSLYKNNFDLAWKKVKFQNKRKSFIKKMMIIASFREESASILDIPRRFFATDGQLSQICAILPQDMNSLRQIKHLRKWILKPEYREKLFELCRDMEDQKEIA